LTNRGVPQVLTPETILQAQRLFGNRAVSRQLAEQRQMKAVLPGSGFPETPAAAASIQRLLSVKDYRKKVKSDEAQQKDLESIAGALGDYHAIKSKTDPTYQQRLAALQALDRLIYAWFNKYVTETIAQVPNGLFFQTLLDDSGTEHQKLVAGVAKNPALLPIDTTGMEKGEKKQLLALWRSIVDGTGNLQIKAGFGEGAFSKRMLSGIAKLLQTEVGQTLIGQINQDRGEDDQTVTVGSGFSKELGKLGKQDPTDSQAVPRTVGDDVTSMAYKPVPKESLTEDNVLEKYDGDESPAAFNKFVTSLKPDTTHFEYGGRVFQRGTGIGSYVKMAGKGKVHANLGTNGQEIVVPEFVTLGHELGHALRFLMGTTVPFGEEMGNFGFKGTPTQKQFWNNPEEFVNIQGVENEIREQHGISKRQFHAGSREATRAPLVNEELTQLFTNGEAKKHKEEYTAIEDIMMKLTILNNSRPRTQDKAAKKEIARIEEVGKGILLSAETRLALDNMYKALKMDKPSDDVSDVPVSSDVITPLSKDVILDKSSSGSKDDGLPKTDDSDKGILLSLPSKLPEPKELGSEEGIDLLPSGSGGKGGRGAYDILKINSVVGAEVPVGEDVESGGLSSGSKKPKSKSSSGSIHNKLHQEGYGKIKSNLAGWLDEHGIRVISNGGGGRNNCLVISLLQHASNNYGPPDNSEVMKYKSLLIEHDIGESDPLLPTDKAFVTLLGQINDDYGRDLKVTYVQAFGGETVPYALIEGESGSEPVAIWDKLGHYEALTT